ncbi:hypothetical protein [Sansalvadorimonas verongulae]|uniref:hypothetical protein n=1 Tax=Sansalvadorimonas verongulae TaxID=2172824 RepID=UPI0012BD18A5|nr:hypothetical protein [Sansalvadorimonas verongulae]MTI15417.1 hypothetical protein [Sansalvadorimonas verongulae]
MEKHLPESKALASPRAQEWQNIRAKAVKEFLPSQWQLVGIDEKTLEENFEQCGEELALLEDDSYLDESLEDSGVFAVKLKQRIAMNQHKAMAKKLGLDDSVLRERVKGAVSDKSEQVALAKDVEMLVAQITKGFVKPCPEEVIPQFQSCMEQIRRIAASLPQKPYASAIVKKALIMQTEATELLAMDVKKSCLCSVYKNFEKDWGLARCSSEEERNELLAVHDLMAFEEYLCDVNGLISGVSAPSQPSADSSDEDEGTAEITAQPSPEEVRQAETRDREREARAQKRYEEAIAGLDAVFKAGQDYNKRLAEQQDKPKDAWQRLLEEKAEYKSPEPSLPDTHIEPVVAVKPPKPERQVELPKDMTSPPATRKKQSRAQVKFRIIDEQTKEVVEARGDKEKMQGVTRKLKKMSDLMGEKLTEKVQVIANKPRTKEKELTQIGHIMGLRKLQETIIPPEARSSDVLSVNDIHPNRPSGIYKTLIELLVQPVLRRFDSPSDLTPQQVRSWSPEQLRDEFMKRDAALYSKEKLECVGKHWQTFKNFLGCRMYPFSYFKDVHSPLALPDEPFGVVVNNTYDNWIGMPLFNRWDYERINSFPADTLATFMKHIFSKETMAALESVFPPQEGMQVRVNKKMLCERPKDAFEIGRTNHTRNSTVIMLFSPEKHQHFLAVRDHKREYVIPCRGRDTSEYLGGRKSLYYVYQSMGMGSPKGPGTSALAV